MKSSRPSRLRKLRLEAAEGPRVDLSGPTRREHDLLGERDVPAGALYGITRRVVLELGIKLGLQTSETDLTRYDLFNADECFLTGTGAELVPVVRIDGRVIGAGTPGPITQRLVEQYRALTKMSGEPIYD